MRSLHAPPLCVRSVRPYRLLLVDDELSTVFAMREFFAHAGYEVDCASTLAAAVALLDQRAFDAVITDLHLTPRRVGEGLKVAWHARRSHPQVCIVMLTAYSCDTTEENATSCGVDVFRTKPIDLAELSAFVELALRRDERADGVPPQWERH